jgi:hypothetical protein
MDNIADFVKRKRKVNVQKTEIKEVKTPWYRRPIEREAFSIKEGKDGKFYAQHNEWSKRVWIGPYASMDKVNKIIDAYVDESLKGTLAKKTMDSIHSVIIEDGQSHFKS